MAIDPVRKIKNIIKCVFLQFCDFSNGVDKNHITPSKPFKNGV